MEVSGRASGSALLVDHRRLLDRGDRLRAATVARLARYSRSMSAMGQDITPSLGHVRFTPESGQRQV
jgi:hypothetical protein